MSEHMETWNEDSGERRMYQTIQELEAENARLRKAGSHLFMHTNHSHACNYTGGTGCNCGVQEARQEWNLALGGDE